MSRRMQSLRLLVAAIVLCGPPWIGAASAQSPARPAATQRSRAVTIGGYAMAGRINLTATDSFEAITGKTGGAIFGGGARVGLPWGSVSWGGPFIDAGAWRFRTDGERVFVANGTVYPLNIPTEITLTALELSAGWQFRFRRMPRFTPYVAAGVTSMGYNEHSSFESTADDVDDSYGGYHLIGGAEFRLIEWIGLAGEASWSTVPDSIGQGGVSAAFNETDLGGTSFRIKITIGR